MSFIPADRRGGDEGESRGRVDGLLEGRGGRRGGDGDVAVRLPGGGRADVAC